MSDFRKELFPTSSRRSRWGRRNDRSPILPRTEAGWQGGVGLRETRGGRGLQGHSREPGRGTRKVWGENEEAQGHEARKTHPQRQ